MSKILVGKDKIYIDGKETKIVSGAMHYFRIHPEYWKDRLLKLKEAGCNCVETYVAWNLHEKREGQFDFSGWLDLGRYIDMAKEMGLYAIVRPGPYICSEWEFGGMPWWILKEQDIALRCANPTFLSKITPYMKKVCEVLRPRLIDNGGNVIFVQVENEYGSYGNDKDYLRYFKDLYKAENITCPLITSDGETEFLLHNGTLPDVMASVNYRWDSVTCLASLRKFRDNQPGAVMELWNGRAQIWGKDLTRRDLDQVELSVRGALEHAELINMYMFHGGTNFGFMNGSLDFGEKLEVQMTSYDVDAPLDEYGRRTPKYYVEQKAICEKLGKKIENTAKDTLIHTYENVRPMGQAILTEALTRKTKSANIITMESCDQGYGYIVYETNMFIGEKGGALILPEIHDIAHIYVDGVYEKTICRHDSDKTVVIKEKGMRRVSILVENMGRVNFGARLLDRKGLVGDVVLHDYEYDAKPKVFGFDIYSIELESLPEVYDTKAEINAPAFYKYEFVADEAADTVLHFKGFTRGVAFINGFNLGRHWAMNDFPNKLFIPAPFIKKGKNEIVVFDVLANDSAKGLHLGEFAPLDF